MSRQEVEDGAAGTSAFREDLQAALQALRGALIDVLAAVGADPSRPQDLARRFRLNKNLTWKISKIAGDANLYGVVPHIPGTQGLEIFLRALGAAGAPREAVEAARRAADHFERVVHVHTGDRATLEIMVHGILPPDLKRERDEHNRKLAFQGNSAMWGMRAETLVALRALAPSGDEPNMADLLHVGGLVGFRRLRRDARCLLFRRERWTDAGPSLAPDRAKSLDPAFPVDEGVPLIGEFCSKPIPRIAVISGEGEDRYELPPGPVGNTAALDCVFGEVTRAVGPTVATGPGELVELGTTIITPVQTLLFDLLVHRDLDWAMNPDLFMFSRLDGSALHSAARRDRNRLPVGEPVHDLGWGIAGLATSLVNNYAKLARLALDGAGWSGDDFRAYRFTMPYPPIPTVAMFVAELPLRAAAR